MCYALNKEPYSHYSSLVQASEGEEKEVEGDVAEEDEQASVSSAAFRERMEALVENQGKDEAYFDGKELARIIYGKYGRSYDVTFMRQVRVLLLSFPLRTISDARGTLLSACGINSNPRP